MKSRCSSRRCRGFSFAEVLFVVMIVTIMAAIALPRLADFRRESVVSRNQANVRELVNAIERFQVNGRYLTNVSSVESVVSQLVGQEYLYPSDKMTSTQITMIYTNGYLLFFETYDN
jgi:prepilin-type N-terminal cleavage/methylation domain-containing protein